MALKGYDTRTFQQYDKNNSTAQRQIGSSSFGTVLPNNPYRKEAEANMYNNVLLGLTGGDSMIPMSGITTYHGSPTSGIKQFSNKFRGTGEGRLPVDSPQRESFKDMIAHGLYTAENQEIAKGYMDRLGKINSTMKIDGVPYDGDKHYALGEIDQIIARAYHSLPSNYRGTKELQRELKDQLKNVFPEWKGRYKEARAKGCTTT